MTSQYPTSLFTYSGFGCSDGISVRKTYHALRLMLASWFLLCGIAWTTPVIAQAVDHCVEVESTNSVGSLLRNKCPFAVNAVWVDHGFCKSGHPCAQGFDANQKQSVPRITGPVRVAACRAPAWPQADGDDESFTCSPSSSQQQREACAQPEAVEWCRNCRSVSDNVQYGRCDDLCSAAAKCGP